MSNHNAEDTDAFGLMKRSRCKDGMVPAGTLGKLILLDLKTLCQFGCGTGLDQELRQTIWDHKDEWMGMIVKYKYQPSGTKDSANSKPRFPVFLGFRHEDDM
jgi:hypothetical protein